MKIRILIVDDSATVRFHTKLLLQKGEFELFEASDGIEGLKTVYAIRPHIVLMDMVMPNMDGITCCSKIKLDPSLKSVKVVMVTTKSGYEHASAAFKAGCDDYVTKPINSAELKSKIEEISKLVRSSEFVNELSLDGRRSHAADRKSDGKRSVKLGLRHRDVLMERAKQLSDRMYERAK